MLLIKLGLKRLGLKLLKALNTIVFGALLLACLSGCSESVSNEEDSTLLVFASASLRDVMREVGATYSENTGVQITFSFAGSNVLARQIEAAPKADIYLSANEHWVTYLDDRNLIDADSKRVFLSNNLVVVSSKESDWVLEHPAQLASIPFRFLSLGDPDAVPAGRYAKQYLDSLAAGHSTGEPADQNETVWSLVSDRLLPAPDVRAAANAVAQLPDILGIIYKTDAIASDKLKVLYEIDLQESDQEERVKYVAASVAKPNQHAHAADFLDFIMKTPAQSIFQSQGFDTILDDPARQ